MIRLATKVIATLLGVAVLATPLFARDLTDAERASLTETVASFDTAMRTNDMERIVQTIPPRVLDAMSAQFGLPVDQLKAAVIEQMGAAMQSVTFESFSMDADLSSSAEMPDGTPYVLIPTEAVMAAGETRFAVTSETLALLDEGQWYLVRVDESQLPLLIEVYPGLSEVEFKPGTMEVIAE